MFLRIMALVLWVGLNALTAVDLYWNPPTSIATNGNVAANWTVGDLGPAATAIGVTDRLFFDGTSTFRNNDCTISSTLVVAGLFSALSGYNGQISDGGNALTVDSGDISLLSGTLSMTGSLMLSVPAGTSSIAIPSGQFLHTVTISVPTLTSRVNIASDLQIANTLTVTGSGVMQWAQPQYAITLVGANGASSFDANMTFAGLSGGGNYAKIISKPSSSNHSVAFPSGTAIPGLDVKGATQLSTSGGSGTLTMENLCTLTIDASTTLTLLAGTTLSFTDAHPQPTFGSLSTIAGTGTLEWKSAGGAFWPASGVSIQCPMVFTGLNSSYSIPDGWIFGPVTFLSPAAKLLTIDMMGKLTASSITLLSSGASALTIRFSAVGATLRSTGDIDDSAAFSSNVSLVANGAPVILDATGSVTLNDTATSWTISSAINGLIVRAGTGVNLSGVTSLGTGTLTLVNTGSGALSPLPTLGTWDVVLKGDGAQINTGTMTINAITSTAGSQAFVVVDSSNAIAAIDLSACKAGVANVITVSGSSTIIRVTKSTKPIATGGTINALPVTTSAILGSAANPTQLRLDISGGTPPTGTRFDGVITVPASVILAPDILPNVLFIGTATGTGTYAWDVVNHEVDVVVSAGGSNPIGFGTPFTPTLVRSTGRDTIFNDVCPGTSEGLARLKASLTGTDPTAIIAYTWDASTQKFIRFPAEPLGGIQPWHAWFIATRVALPLDFSGTPINPGNVAVDKMWNFIGYPPVISSDLTTTYYDHRFVDVVFEQNSVIITGTARDAVIGKQIYFWNGSSYSTKTTFNSGFGYWIYNTAGGGSTEALTRTVTSTVIYGKPRAAAAGSTTVTHSDPPSPPGQPAQSESSGGGCGGGSAAALLMIILVGISLGRAKRR